MSKHRLLPRNDEGFTLLELSMSMVAATVVMLVLYGSVTLTVQSRRTVEAKGDVSRNAQDFLTRLREIPFGTDAVSPASGAQLAELFDDDDDLGSVVLTQLVVAASATGHVFAVQDRERTVTWRVRVTRDLNGDGIVSGGREGRTDLLRLDVLADDRPVLWSVRAADPELTVKDP